MGSIESTTAARIVPAAPSPEEQVGRTKRTVPRIVGAPEGGYPGALWDEIVRWIAGRG